MPPWQANLPEALYANTAGTAQALSGGIFSVERCLFSGTLCFMRRMERYALNIAAGPFCSWIEESAPVFHQSSRFVENLVRFLFLTSAFHSFCNILCET